MDQRKAFDIVLEQVELKNCPPLTERSTSENNHRCDSSPFYIKGGGMKVSQVQELNWMISQFDNGVNSILVNDEMDFVILQTISLLGYMKHRRNINSTHSMVIVPESTHANWMNEFKKRCPSLKTVNLTGDHETRVRLTLHLLSLDYEMFVSIK